MANIIVTMKLMPDSPKEDLARIEKEARRLISSWTGRDDAQKEIEPVAYGLNALKILFVMDEQKGSTENLENEVAKISGVSSVDITDVRRAIG
jgi:elongation factor 1-beta